MDRICTVQEMAEFVVAYYKGEMPNQRFGQAFCNYFDYTCPELFYQEDTGVAEEFIWYFLVS